MGTFISGKSAVSEQAGAENEHPYTQLLGLISDYVCIVHVRDGQAVRTRHNEQCFPLTGYTPEEFEADPFLWLRVVHCDDRMLAIRQAEDILSGRGAPPIVHRIVRKDGGVKEVLNTPILFHDADGTLIRYDAVIRDVTDHVTQELSEPLHSSRVVGAAEALRDDLMQALAAGRFRISALARAAREEKGIQEALLEIERLLDECGQNARTISRQLTFERAPDEDQTEGVI
jgi:PAS domain S-box-containing protein